MALELVTGYWGIEHVTAEQDADLNAGIIGSGNYVLNIGEKMRAEAVSANQVRIFDGVFMAYGRQCILGDGEYEDVTIENGTPGLLRNDMIVVKYKKDEESGKENAIFVVLKGETGSVGKDPVPNKQDIRSGAFESEVPMYRVKINGLAIEKIEPLFSIPLTNDDLSNKFNELDAKLVEKTVTLKAGGDKVIGSAFLKNGIVQVAIDFQKAFTVSKEVSTKLFTLPAGMRPKTYVYQLLSTLNPNAEVRCQITTDGSINVYSTADTDYFLGNVTFTI